MLKSENRFSRDADNKLNHAAVGSSPALRQRNRLGTVACRVLFVAVVFLVAAGLLACSSSTAGDNQGAKAPASKNAPPAPTPAGSSPSGAPKAAAKAAPTIAPPVAQPKKIVPAPTVTATGKQARIAFKTEEADFGNVQFGEIVQYLFDFKNVGSETLTVSNVQIETVEGC